MKIVWTELAVDRAYEAAAYIAADKPGAAEAWLDGLFAATETAERFPASGRIVPEIGLPDYREIVYRRSHRVIYRIEESVIVILTVRNCAQLLDTEDLEHE